MVYCAAGSRSSSAAEQLKKMGFKNVYDLDGGMTAWRETGKKVAK
ncbi:MAG: rhodanese-like domain-containing protein [Lewinellaceae bacterium]|nr:rhodanese-like domain-containing protein [Lewinellaceae bacterium]